MKRIGWISVALFFAVTIVGCDSTPLPRVQHNNAKSDSVVFMANQIGFSQGQQKFVVINNQQVNDFTVINLATNNVVLEGTLSKGQAWQPAGKELYRSVDLSALQQQGQFRLKLNGVANSFDFSINDQPYQPLHDAALKAFYYNRASTSISSVHSDVYMREAGHPDNKVFVHQSAATKSRPAGTVLESKKGWYDAGDFGKYVVNSGISSYTLLLSYDQHKAFYKQRPLHIPESNNDLPDILDEIKWNLDWLASMQDEDGGVYHKLTTLEWPGIEMPNQDTRDRYVIGKSTSATLNFAATMAYASRVYSTELASSRESDIWLAAAKSAWNWAQNNPSVIYEQPQDVKSGEYGDSELSDELLWASVELYLATKNTNYLAYFDSDAVELIHPSWQHVSVLPLISLSNYRGTGVDKKLISKANIRLTELADEYIKHYQDSPFKVAMIESDFVWGSNSVALNKAIVLAQAFKVTGRNEYKQAAEGNIDYVLGKNPLAFSFITGFGKNAVQFPHHRASAADNIDAPIPGLIAGGPQPGKQDGCAYRFSEPAKTYVDDWCSYATNEVAINWNAPLVYMLAFKLSL